MSGADERYFGGGEVIGVEAAAAVMSAAPSGADVVECTRNCCVRGEYRSSLRKLWSCALPRKATNNLAIQLKPSAALAA